MFLANSRPSMIITTSFTLGGTFLGDNLREFTLKRQQTKDTKLGHRFDFIILIISEVMFFLYFAKKKIIIMIYSFFRKVDRV